MGLYLGWYGMVPRFGLEVRIDEYLPILWEGKTDERLHFIGGRSIPLDIYTDWKGVLA